MTLAITLGLTVHLFYLFNFTYIGTCVAAGLFLHRKKVKHARIAVLFAVGLYMLDYLGFISKENMQIEGFWIFLFNGIFYASVLHYAIAEIVGPDFPFYFFIIYLINSVLDDFSLKNVATNIFFYKFGY